MLSPPVYSEAVPPHHIPAMQKLKVKEVLEQKFDIPVKSLPFVLKSQKQCLRNYKYLLLKQQSVQDEAEYQLILLPSMRQKRG